MYVGGGTEEGGWGRGGVGRGMDEIWRREDGVEGMEEDGGMEEGGWGRGNGGRRGYKGGGWSIIKYEI